MPRKNISRRVYLASAETVQLSKCYEVTEMTVSKFNGRRVFKASDQTVIKELANTEINIASNYTASELGFSKKKQKNRAPPIRG